MTDSTLRRRGVLLGLLLALPLAGVSAQPAAPRPWVVKPEWVKADEEYLASDALQGRGSATPDEAKAAAWVAARFEEFGLVRAPGMGSFLQTATVVQPKRGGAPVLSVAGETVPGVALLMAPAGDVSGRLAVAASGDAGALPGTDVIAVASPTPSLFPVMMAARAKGAKLLLVRENAETRRIRERIGGEAPMPAFLEGDTPEAIAVASVPAAAFDRLVRQPGQEATLALPGLTATRSITTNAIGFLPGTDPEAGVLLLSAHVDHLGRRADGTIMHGADDDASGVTAVLELARALAAGPRSRRGILFVCYGAEEMGGFGSAYFGAHPPLPLSKIAANIEFEMIGAQDPKLPRGSLMVTGFERSNLAEALAAHGALVAPDPYPQEHFFERSDNYQLALKGVVAHTLSGWATTPVYHQPTDTIANLDMPFLTKAIQSLIEPVRWLAAGDFQPQWKTGGRPTR
jgi:Iap family predicted aminopeptidase